MESKESVKAVYYKNGFTIRRKNHRIIALLIEGFGWHIIFNKCIKETDVNKDLDLEKYHDLVFRRVGLILLTSDILLSSIAFKSMSIAFLEFSNIDWSKFEKQNESEFKK